MNSCVCSGLFFGDFLQRMLSWNPDARASVNQGIRIESMTRFFFRRSVCFRIPQVLLWCFPEALEAVCLFFVVLETGMKIDGFSSGCWIQRSTGGAAKSR